MLVSTGVPASSGAEDWAGELWQTGFPVVTAQAEPRFEFDIPAEPLAVALTRFEQVTGLKVAADSRTVGAARTPGR